MGSFEQRSWWSDLGLDKDPWLYVNESKGYSRGKKCCRFERRESEENRRINRQGKQYDC